MNRRNTEGNVGNQKKRIAVLCMLLVAGGGWIGLASRQADGARTDRAAPDEPAPSFLSDPDLAADDGGLANGELFLKMMLSVGIVIGLGVVALYVSKRVLPRVTNAQGKEVRVVETTCLGPRKALHLVEVGGQRLLIASTNENITALAHLSDGWLEMPRQDVADSVKL